MHFREKYKPMKKNKLIKKDVIVENQDVRKNIANAIVQELNVLNIVSVRIVRILMDLVQVIRDKN